MRTVLFLSAVAAAQAAIAAPAGRGELPIVEIEAQGPRTFEFRGLAPNSWSSDTVRNMMLRRSAELAAERGESCFVLREARLQNGVAYMPLKSGHVTVTTGEGSSEWRHYWRLYRQLFRGPGVRLMDQPRSSDKLARAIEARMIVELCNGGAAQGGGTRFEVSRILARR
ncbi:hypothetical protein [Blastomonas sp. CCH4-D12]|uniref:hypothetical protein n=1 Tax=Blastomonas sp. CCH4-D12 TaxID=1768751 RepID=UPI000A973361|nr:hypothetical protein [Blastomonas sp. CCH4-D12]